jgi:hypothetical protein
LRPEVRIVRKWKWVRRSFIRPWQLSSQVWDEKRIWSIVWANRKELHLAPSNIPENHLYSHLHENFRSYRMLRKLFVSKRDDVIEEILVLRGCIH